MATLQLCNLQPATLQLCNFLTRPNRVGEGVLEGGGVVAAPAGA
ncbi:MAG: hypothetical protein KIH69_018015 [Anaerolineae bacterium]|nr:hypothetical protein [Anaerolineae bacterium]